MSVREAFYFVTCEAYGNAFPLECFDSHEGGLNMEVLIRWECHCTAPRWACADCGGEGIFERWLPIEDLPLMCTDYVMLSTQRMKRAA